MLPNKNTCRHKLHIIHIWLGLSLSACSVETAQSIEVAEPPTSWGAFEHTQVNFKSITASIECPREGKGVYYIDPLPKIIELARKHNVVMINEAHYKPIHRAFIGELAIALREIEFGFYGAETFNPNAFSEQNRHPSLSARGYPVLKDGVYSTEPIYGQLIETLIENDYTLFAYENEQPLPKGARDQIAHRDFQQAKNILSEIDGVPDKKGLIHAGYHHVRETENRSGDKWMAQFFQEQSGIDPLTISQTDCYSDNAFEAGTLGYAMPVDIDGNPISVDGYDVVIIPPKESFYKDRPTWLRDVSGRHFTDLPSNLKFDDQYTRVTAYNVEKEEDAVVEDTIYRPPHADKPLALRSGTYRIVVTDKSKTVLAQTKITIP